jgi:hypothetical protein
MLFRDPSNMASRDLTLSKHRWIQPTHQQFSSLWVSSKPLWVSTIVHPWLTWSLPTLSRGRPRPIFKLGASIPDPAIDPADGRSPPPLPPPPCALTTPSAFPTGGCSKSSPTNSDYRSHVIQIHQFLHLSQVASM